MVTDNNLPGEHQQGLFRPGGEVGVSSLQEDGGKNVVDVLDEELLPGAEVLARAEEDDGGEDLLRVGAGTHLLGTDRQDVMFLGQHGSSEARQAWHGDCRVRPEEKLQQQVKYWGG